MGGRGRRGRGVGEGGEGERGSGKRWVFYLGLWSGDGLVDGEILVKGEGETRVTRGEGEKVRQEPGKAWRWL